MGCVPLAVVPDNIKPAVIKPSRYEPVLNETYADLLDHYGAHGLPARSQAAARQGAGRERGAAGRAPGPGADAPPRLPRPGLAQRGDRRGGRGVQRPALQRRLRRVPANPVRGDRPAAHEALAGQLLAAHGVAPEQGAQGLSHRASRGTSTRCRYEYIDQRGRRPPARRSDRGVPQGPADRQPCAQPSQGPRHHGPGTPAAQAPARRDRGNPRLDRARSLRARRACARLRRGGHGPLRQAGARLPGLPRRSPSRSGATTRNASTPPADTRSSSAAPPIAGSTRSCAPAPISPISRAAPEAPCPDHANIRGAEYFK